MTRRRRLSAIVIAAVTLSISLVVPPPAVSAADAGCSLEDDLVVGAPAEDVGPIAEAGAVTVVFGGPGGFGSAGGMLLTQESVGEVSETGDRFGAAVAIDGVIGDGCTDLIIGVPGEDQGTGQVVIIPGSPTGLNPAGTVVLRQGLAGVAGNAEVGDAFGATLAVPGLWVGAPFEDVGNAVDAGAVTHIQFFPDPAHVESVEYTQAVAGIPGVPETGDHFGAAVVVTAGPDYSPGPAVVGVPGEDVGRIVDAGVVVFLAGRPDAVSQDTSGVPGKAEPGDRFGASLAGVVGPSCEDDGPGSAIGSPGEDVGSVVNAGSVTHLSSPFYPPLNRATAITDAVVEPYDGFGSALSGNFGGLMIGTPGENVGLINNAGAVTWQEMHCFADSEFQEFGARRVFTQRTRGIPGAAERDDAFGATLGWVGLPLTFVVGVPGEGVGRVATAGAVTLLPAVFGEPTAAGSRFLSQSSAGIPGASETGDRFGAVLHAEPR
jgi:hypothetical protein